ncbi:tyrosine-protein phosphatase 10D-like isoform X1 [Palaemon carinicauda]|uniref:tyrosine-protein phosphatase 10D-like isoform X1 n=1 Tax=Palaemon carinicauda TaxID=392227 RepID=UPI0035B6A299
MFSSSVRVFVCDQLPGHNSNGPNAPGRFIMWYRNETAILALWHRPHPAGIYSHYQVFGADVVIQFPPERFPDKDGFYRLDYWPPQGAPPPNTTFTPAKVVEGIELTRVLPGTKYDFQLYYCNDTLSHLPRWTASIAIVPSPPSNLTIEVGRVWEALASWDPPQTGGYSAFKLKVTLISESENSIANFPISENQMTFALRESDAGGVVGVAALHRLRDRRE